MAKTPIQAGVIRVCLFSTVVSAAMSLPTSLIYSVKNIFFSFQIRLLVLRMIVIEVIYDLSS